MKNQTLEKIDRLIEQLCVVSYDRVKRINTDKVIALAEAVAKILAARAALVKD